MRRTNAQGVHIIKSSEALRLKAYRCPAGKWTIGYGDTGPTVRPGLTITEAEAEERLARRLAFEFEPGVEQLLAVSVTGNQFSALVSFAYNCGLGEDGLAGSTLLRKLNAGDYDGAADEFPRWTRSKGRVQPGLVTRRAAERELFCTPGDGEPA
ncbi:lysozyme [Humidesulfovibrio mexicanus]|uniref:Lysozyme n=1 Tax=Humidesulfovibrio mexicanus TaxID=147047 RepID=A0A239AKQ9_9BACT|nr:lysozyme [Humidesulfovibrio mexicanus]SNR95578.1 lysozyme [Humidesulfovibrio mexicanus]